MVRQNWWFRWSKPVDLSGRLAPEPVRRTQPELRRRNGMDASHFEVEVSGELEKKVDPPGRRHR
jgi:hypothetical protein